MAFGIEAEGAAAFADERLRRISSYAAAGVFEIDKAGRLIFANARWREFSGSAAPEGGDDVWYAGVDPRDRDDLMDDWRLALSEGAAFERSVRMAARPHVRLSLHPLKDGDRVNGFIGTAIDLSEFAHLERALAQSRNQFEALVEGMPHLVWTSLADGTIEYLNQRFIAYTGLTIEAARGSGVKGVVHPDELGVTWERWNTALLRGEPYEVEYRLRDVRDGSYRWFLARAVPVRDDGGCIVRWIGSATDIDAQRRANDNLRFVLEASAALAESLDVTTVCNVLSKLAVARIADWCFVTLVDESGAYDTSCIAHRDPAFVSDALAMARRYQAQPGGPLDNAIRRNVSILMPSVDPEELRRAAENEEHLRLLQRLNLHSAMIAPIAGADGKVLGAVSFVSSESVRSFSRQDLEVAEMVVQRAAAAIQTARTFGHEREAAQRLAFLAKASDLLLQGVDVGHTLQALAGLAVADLCEMAVIFSVEDQDALRISAIAHRDPEKDRIAAHFLGQRALRRTAEESAIKVFSQHTTQVRGDIAFGDPAAHLWDYLLADAEALEVESSIVVPLHSRGNTFGALAVYWARGMRDGIDGSVPLFEDLGHRISMAIEYAGTLERERRVASALQQALLPHAGMLPDLPGVVIDSVYRSSSRETDVGGDWYDALQLPDGSVAVSVGDVTGRGLRAAGLMGKLRQALAAIALYESDPARMLDSADYLLRKRHPTAIATAFLGIINNGGTSLRYANAGHPPPILRLGDRLVELRSDGLPLGLRDQHAETAKTIALDDAQMLVLYTDGLTEATRDLSFGESRLREVAASDAVMYARNAAELICDACLPPDVQDDTAVLVLRFSDAVRWSFDAENAAAAQEARGDFVRHLQRFCGPDADYKAAEVVFGELVGNVVRHAPGAIDIQLEWRNGSAVLHVSDRGRGILREPALPENPLSESGRGLFIVQQLTEGVFSERIAGYGNHVWAQLRLRRVEEA